MSRLPRMGLLLLLVACLAGCATRAPSPSPARPGSDGPEERTPPNLMKVPDALPRLEPIREAGPNKPYDVMGERYEPLRADAEYRESGLASWYGGKFHGRKTASGERFNRNGLTAAHRTLPMGSRVRVVHSGNGRAVTVRINDRGPYSKRRILDLSEAAARRLRMIDQGVAPVTVHVVSVPGR